MKCQNCNKHKGTINWVGDGGMMAFTHGWGVPWCECCVLKENLNYANQQALKIKGYKKELKKIKCV